MIQYDGYELSVIVNKYQDNGATALLLEDNEDGTPYAVVSTNIEFHSDVLPKDCFYVAPYKNKELLSFLLSKRILRSLPFPSIQQGYGTFKPYEINLGEVDEFIGTSLHEIMTNVAQTINEE